MLSCELFLFNFNSHSTAALHSLCFTTVMSDVIVSYVEFYLSSDRFVFFPCEHFGMKPAQVILMEKTFHLQHATCRISSSLALPPIMKVVAQSQARSRGNICEWTSWHLLKWQIVNVQCSWTKWFYNWAITTWHQIKQTSDVCTLRKSRRARKNKTKTLHVCFTSQSRRN